MRVRPFIAVALAGLLSTGACGGGDGPAEPPRSPKESFQARLRLQRYFRALAVGDRAACSYMSRDFDYDGFGPPGCLYAFSEEHAKFEDDDIAALRRVTVPTAKKGAGGVYVVRHTDLDWDGDPAGLPEFGVQEEPDTNFLVSRYILHKDKEGRWLITTTDDPGVGTPTPAPQP